MKQKTSSGRKRKAKPPERPLSAERAAFAARMRAGFQDIGHFIFEFSQLEFTIRAVLSSALKLPDGYFDIVTSGYDFAMLCNVTRAVALKQRPDHEPAIEKLFNDCLKLNDERVRVAHGMWTFGGEGVVARHVGRRNLQPKYYFENQDALVRLAAEAQRLMQAALSFRAV